MIPTELPVTYQSAANKRTKTKTKRRNVQKNSDLTSHTVKGTALQTLPAYVPPSESRSRNMAAIKSTNTGPELYVRQALHAAGFRFRLHRKDIPGKPDIVLPRYKTAVFVHCCFWHGHGCKVDHKPRSNTPYWSAKIGRNVDRDARNLKAAEEAGWRLVVIWECCLEGQTAQLIGDLKIMFAFKT